MKKYAPKLIFILLTTIIVFGVSFCASTNMVYAQGMPHTFAPSSQTTNSATSQTAPSVSSIVGGIIATAVAPIAILVLKIVSLITGLAGFILNYVVNYTIVEMSKNYGGITAINTAWSTIRDVANMGFIFVLLYASIQMILGIGKDTRKLIVNMIIAALLINFSLFFTKVVIDSSNLLAMTFYNAMVPVNAGSGSLLYSNDVLNTGLSNALMEPLNLQSIWAMSGGLNPSNLATIGVMGSILSLIAAFVFFAIALLFVIRYVVLIFVLILSPIAFVSGVIPGLNKVAGQWKDALFNQAFFAPVYMLLTWVTISIFQNLPKGTSSLADAVAGTMKTVNGQDTMVFSPDTMGILFNFVVVIVFLIATIIVSKNMASKSGPAVGKLVNSAMGFAGGATLGLAGYVGRRTIGAKAGADLNNEDLKERAASGDLRARLQLKVAGKAAGSSFDFRGTGLGGTLGAGKAGGKGGYNQMVKDEAKKKEEFEKSLAPSDTVIDRAKQNLEKAKDAKDQPAIDKAQAELHRIEGNKKDVEENVKKAEEKKKKDVASAKEDKVLKEALEKEKTFRDLVAKLSVDAQTLSGTEKIAAQNKLSVAESEYKEAKDKTSIERVRVNNKITEIETKSDEEIKTIKNSEVKGLGEKRIQARAIGMSNPGRVGLDRVLLVGKVKRSSLQAAANLRKKKKDVKSTLEELLKDTGEIKKENKPDEESNNDENREKPKE